MDGIYRCDRYLPKRGSYVVFSPSLTRRGPILHISHTGLCCLYYADEASDVRSLDTCADIRYGNVSIGGISFRIFSDERVGTECFGPFTMVRRRFLIFEALSAGQEVQMDYFIRNFTRLNPDFC